MAKQFDYNDQVPTQYYQAFAKAAGCGGPGTFQCLVNADTTTLQNASAAVSTSGEFGTFAFLPVTDGSFIQSAPSRQLFRKAVSGKRALVGVSQSIPQKVSKITPTNLNSSQNNANEGAPLTPPTINSPSSFLSYVRTTFPRLTQSDLIGLLRIYRFNPIPPNPKSPLYDTLGDSGPTALTQSSFAIGPKQLAFNLNSEITFTCPGYWLAEAFSGGGKQSWKYQYSVTPSYHGADLSAYFSVNATVPSRDFIHAFQKLWGNFIINNNPVISLDDAKGTTPGASVPIGNGGNLAWPTYDEKNHVQLDLNTTGGTVEIIPVTPDYSYAVREGEGVRNVFRVVDADKWEGGRGERCRYWRSVAGRVPE